MREPVTVCRPELTECRGVLVVTAALAMGAFATVPLVAVCSTLSRFARPRGGTDDGPCESLPLAPPSPPLPPESLRRRSIDRRLPNRSGRDAEKVEEVGEVEEIDGVEDGVPEAALADPAGRVRPGPVGVLPIAPLPAASRLRRSIDSRLPKRSGRDTEEVTATLPGDVGAAAGTVTTVGGLVACAGVVACAPGLKATTRPDVTAGAGDALRSPLRTRSVAGGSAALPADSA